MVETRDGIRGFLLVVVVLCCAQAAGGEVSSDPNAQRQALLARVAGLADSPQACHDLLERRFLEGHWDDVKAALDQRDADGAYVLADYRFALLRARCAREVFTRYSRSANPRGRPAEEQGAELRRLARDATTAYEEAFRLAPCAFERACVYARWHELHTISRFEADSLLLRSGSPLEQVGEPAGETLAQQASRLRAAASQVLGSLTPSGNPMERPAQDAFLDVLTEEYLKVGRIDVPEEVFAEVLEDVPEFLQKAIHPMVLAYPDKNRITLQCHLWYALTGPRPDAIEEEFIDRQIQTVDWCLQQGMAGAGPEYGQAASQAFLEMVRIERNNRLVLHFKRAFLPRQWSDPERDGEGIEKDVLERIDHALEQLAERARLPMARFLSAEETEKRAQERVAMTIRSLTVSLMTQLAPLPFAPGRQQPPGATVSGGGTTHRESNIWVYTADNYQPIPPYPWKKSITPIDSSRASARQIAQRVLTALARGDTATLDTLVVVSRGFSKNDARHLAGMLNEAAESAQPVRVDDVNDILIEEPWSWSAVRAAHAELPLALVLRWKEGAYWLAWAGAVQEQSRSALASVLEELKPHLELPPAAEPVAVLPPAHIASVEDIGAIESLEVISAGHSWRVQLALIERGDLSPARRLYCRAQWTDANRPARPIPFGRYTARHLGPVIWTCSEAGFQEHAPELSGYPAPPVTVCADGCLYAALLPLGGFKDLYVQVYSAFDGGELARQHLGPAEASAWPWGHFMAYKPGEPFGVAAGFEPAFPGLPAFKAAMSGAQGPSITLSLKDGFFELRTDQRMLPTRGSRLLARWWVNGQPVIPLQSRGPIGAAGLGNESLARVLRLPANLSVLLNARRGDRIGLQVMLAPDRVESVSLGNEQERCIATLDERHTPSVPLLSNRIEFRADAQMLAPRNLAAPTRANVQALADAIRDRDVRQVRRLLATCPQLASSGAQVVGNIGVSFVQVWGGVIAGNTATSTTGAAQAPLDLLCRHRPQARYFFRWRFGGDVTPAYWRDMAQIAGLLIDYGADVNAAGQAGRVPLAALLDSPFSFGRADEEAPPVELCELLLERGADPEAASHEGTLLSQLVRKIESDTSERLYPLVEVLLRHGADVFAISEPWQSDPVIERLDTLTKEGHAELAALIRTSGQERRVELERAVSVGVEEFLAGVRHADEPALSALVQDFPATLNTDWLRIGRRLQMQLGPSLEGLGVSGSPSLKGIWAEVFIPTGRPGDSANLYVVLLRYPGGAYHAVQAGLVATAETGMHIRSAGMNFDELVNAVYCPFGRFDQSRRIGGGYRTQYPRWYETLSIRCPRGRLVVWGQNSSSRRFFHAELAPDLVFFWDTAWELNLSRRMTFATDEQELVLADGVMTVRNPDRTLTFSPSGANVRLQTDGTERIGAEFLLNLNTLDVTCPDEATE
ncbi:MAG: hypothetical protein JW993_19015 [Sedimentisphaerales bacterium]|nr:hypothetical protein [Sedimentisphaerales bacterium]